MPVSILLVQVTEGLESEVLKNIDQLASAGVTESGKGFLVAATDTKTPQEDIQLIEKIQKLEHVMNVSLVMTADEDALDGEIL